MPSKKKKYNSRFPPARIKKIMQTDEDVGKVAAAVPVIISRALELFIESLIIKTSETTKIRSAKTLSTAHIKHTIQSENQFDFLKDLVANIPDVQPGEEEGEGQPATETVHVPKPRGRPKKKQTENEEVGECSKPKRKRRKRVTQPRDSEETDSATEVPEEKVESEQEEEEEEEEKEEEESHTSNSDEEDYDIPNRPSRVTFQEDSPSSSIVSVPDTKPLELCQSTSGCDQGSYPFNSQPSSMPYSSTAASYQHSPDVSRKHLSESDDSVHSNNQNIPRKLSAEVENSSLIPISSLKKENEPANITSQENVGDEENYSEVPLCLSMKASKEKPNGNSSSASNTECSDKCKEEPHATSSDATLSKNTDIPSTMPYPAFRGCPPMPPTSGYYPMPGMPPYPVPPGMPPFPPGMIGYPPFPVNPMMMPPGQGMMPPYPRHIPPMMDPRYMMPGLNCFPPVTVPRARGTTDDPFTESPPQKQDHLNKPSPSGAVEEEDYDNS